MTITEAKRIYLSVFPGMRYEHSDSEWKDIAAEMEAVLGAKSDRAAARLIDWWGCWSRELSATKAAKLLRQAGSDR